MISETPTGNLLGCSGIIVREPVMIVMLFGISYLSASVANWFVNVRLLRDDEKRRRMELEKIFGVDFGGLGESGLELV